jgi:hypothetical protein
VTKREQTMAAGVLGVVILGGVGFLFNVFFLRPLSARQASIAQFQADIARKEERIRQVEAQRLQLLQWKRESLPGDTDQDQMPTTRRLYSEYLRDLLTESGLASPTLKIDSVKPDTRTSPMLPGKKPVYTRLKFTVEEARGNLAALVTMLERFYRTPLLHEIKEISVQRPRTRTGGQRADDLDVKLTVEALVVNGAEVRSYLLFVDPRLMVADAVAGLAGGPVGLGAALWEAGPGGKLAPTPLARSERSYADIAGKNVFYPAAAEEKKPDVDVARFVYLTDITRDDRRSQAFLYDRYNNRTTRLRASRGFDSFRVVDENGKPIVRGKVVRMTERDVYFEADEKFYVIHVGESLDEALRKPLPKQKVEELKPVAER